MRITAIASRHYPQSSKSRNLRRMKNNNDDLTYFDRILLHLRCLFHDHKYRWHLAGVWRELGPSRRTKPISPATA
jgi:hypothetical protein